MAITNALHRTWAQALHSVAQNHEEAFAFEEELTGIETLMTEVPDFRIFVTTPDVKLDEKTALLRKVFSGKVSPNMLNFLLVAVGKGRIGELSGMHQAFVDILDSGEGRQRVQVISAIELTDDLADSLRKQLGEQLGKQVVLEQEVDPRIIGGLVIQYGDTRVDGSIRRRIAKFRKDIKHRVKAPTS